MEGEEFGRGWVSPLLPWVIAVREVGFSGGTSAIGPGPASSLGNMMLTSALLSIAYVLLLCGVPRYCSFWSLSYCRARLLQRWEHLGLDSQTSHKFHCHPSVFKVKVISPFPWLSLIPLDEVFLLGANDALGVWISFPPLPLLSFFPPWALVLLSCRGVGWEGAGEPEGQSGYCVSSWIRPAKQITLLASFPGYFQVVRLIHPLLMAFWKDPQAV